MCTHPLCLLVCRCVLNWFGDWSTSAFYQVGLEFTSKLDIDRSDVSQHVTSVNLYSLFIIGPVHILSCPLQRLLVCLPLPMSVVVHSSRLLPRRLSRPAPPTLPQTGCGECVCLRPSDHAPGQHTSGQERRKLCNCFTQELSGLHQPLCKQLPLCSACASVLGV